MLKGVSVTDIPAFCECGHVFYSGISVSGANNVFSNCGSRCPKCGKMVTINAKTDEKGNLHLFSNTAFRVLSSAAISQHELFQLKAMVKEQIAKKEDSQENQFIESIQQNLPDLDEITNLLTPTNAGEFYGFLSFLLALVTFIILMRGSSKQASPLLHP